MRRSEGTLLIRVESGGDACGSIEVIVERQGEGSHCTGCMIGYVT